MSRVFRLLALLVIAALPVLAEDGGRRMLDDAEAVTYRGVGRVNVAGTRFCTGALVSETLVLTAAHCLYHPRTHAPVPLAEMRFVAGKRRDAFAALRGVVRAAVPVDFVYDGTPRFDSLRRDIALLELDAPVTDAEAPAFAIGPAPPAEALAAIISYARDRREAASVQESCGVAALIGEVAALDCGVNLGASGSPVFRQDDGRVVWAVVSSTGTLADGAPVTLAVRVAPEMEGLRARLSETLPAAGGMP